MVNHKKVRQHGVKGAYVGGDCKWTNPVKFIRSSRPLQAVFARSKSGRSRKLRPSFLTLFDILLVFHYLQKSAGVDIEDCGERVSV